MTATVWLPLSLFVPVLTGNALMHPWPVSTRSISSPLPLVSLHPHPTPLAPRPPLEPHAEEQPIATEEGPIPPPRHHPQIEEQPIETSEGPLGNPRGPEDDIEFTTCQRIIHTPNPQCQWTKIETATGYRINIQGPQVNCIIQSTHPQLTYPTTCNSMQQNNTYKLTVVALDQANETIASGDIRLTYQAKKQP